MRPILVVASATALAAVPATAHDGGGAGPMQFVVSSAVAAYAGDHELLATISPNGDGYRDRALIRFRLEQPADVDVSIAAVGPGARTVFERRLSLAEPGWHVVPWRPRRIDARTYVVRLAVRDESGRVTSLGFDRPAGTPVVRVLGIEAAFTRESYAPGQLAQLELATDERKLTLQVFRAGADGRPAPAGDAMNGDAVTRPIRIGWLHRRNRPGRLRLRVGDWPTGLYYAKLTGPRGRTGYAPFVVRPRRLGQHRVAVVLPTFSWQAYNFRDTDGDGYGETWYAGRTGRTLLGRAYLDHGVPPRFRSYDLGFLLWLGRAERGGDRAVDFLSDSDLAAIPRGADLTRIYDLIVFPGHHEYVTPSELEAVRTFRDLGGNLIFLSANNFFWCVDRQGRRLSRVVKWRDVGHPEAALTGVQYVAGDRGGKQAPFVVSDVSRAPWLFAGTGLETGSRFGRFGIEIDATTRSSPPGTIVLAEIPHLFGRGRTAQMTYYETAKGAKVFAAGAFTLAGDANHAPVARLLDNLWARLARP